MVGVVTRRVRVDSGMITIRRIRYKDWYIQSRKCRRGRHEFMAWASREPCNDDIAYAFTGKDVYSNFGDTELEAIETTKKELDSVIGGETQ